MAKDWNCFWKFFAFENFSTWASRPWELGHLKNLYVFPLPSKCTFEPLIIIFRAFPSPYLLSSAPSSLISFQMRLWSSFLGCFQALISFQVHLRASSPLKCTFEPLIIIFRALSSPYLLSVRLRALSPFKCAFEPLIIIFRALSSPYLLSSAPLSPRLPSSAPLSPRLPFERAFEPSLPSSAPLSPRLLFERAFEPLFSFLVRLGALAFFHFFFSAPLSPRFLSSAPSSPRPFFWVHFRALIFLSSFFTWIGHPSHWDPFFVFFHLGRSPITIRPLLNKKQKKQKKQQKKNKIFFLVIFQMTCFLISTFPCKSHISIYCFQSFQD